MAILESGFSAGGLLHKIVPKELPGSQQLAIPQAIMGSDRYWMLEAFQESMKGIGITNPNPAVGCVIIDSNGQEISRGHTQAYRGLHAERSALNKLDTITASDQLNGATAYVTLEPCSHFGNQPPCVDLFLNSKIRRIVISCPDPNPIINGEGIRKLQAAGKEVSIGLFSPEVSAWNLPFFASQKLKRPFIALKWAQTLDGQLADDSNTSQWISGPVSRSYTHWLRQKYDAILVGARTALADLPSLDVRDCNPPHQSQPLPILFDPKGQCLEADTALQARLSERTFHTDRPLVYVTTNAAAQRRLKDNWIFKRENITPITLHSLKSEEWVPELLSLLKSSEIEKLLTHPLQSVFVEGGPATLSIFLKSNQVDFIHAFVAPALSGGLRNRIHLNKLLREKLEFTPVATSQLGNDVLMELMSPTLK